jgi:hypothetical protein
VSIEYAVEELTAAVKVLAADGADLSTRLQRAWDAHYQNLWTSVYLPEHLNVRFKELWETYTAPSDDRFSTKLREMSDEELAELASAIVQLAVDTASAAARGEEPAPRPAPRGTA